MSASDHASARIHAIRGFEARFGRSPTLPEVQALQGVGFLETGYGFGWKGTGRGSNNIGAIIAGSSWKGEVFVHRDSKPRDDGTNEWYEIAFRKYQSLAEGWRDLANEVYGDRPTVLAEATEGDLWGVSAALYATKYYLGFGRTAQDRIQNHYDALLRAVRKQAQSLGELMPDGTRPPPPTLRRGDRGDWVKEWQRVLGVAADSAFGAVTEAATREWQSERGLKPDGIVGPKTWAVADVALDEAAEQAVTLVPPRETLRVGSHGPLVTEWKIELARSAMGDLFDALTEEFTRGWQTIHDLEPDGVVGPKTWAMYDEEKS